MIRLAYVFERFPSFTQTFCVREIEQLERLGVWPLIFSIRDTRDEAIQHFPKALMDRVHFLPQRDELIKQVRDWKDEKGLPRAAALVLRHWGGRGDKARVYEAAYIAKIIADLPAAERPQHVHSHFAGVGARTCWWLRKFSGVSYSFTAHANDIFCKPEDETVPFPSLFEEAALIVTVSDYSANQLRERFPSAASRVRRVYNGMDLAPFTEARAKANRFQSQGGILSVGRLIEKKGYADLITACGLLRDQEVSFYCRIVGEGPLEAELKAQIESLGLEDNVELAGPKDIAEIRKLMAERTQVFALACATEHDGGKDNLPTVLMEAMAAALPCISTRLAGVPEMVLDGLTGLLCSERKPEALARHLYALLNDPSQCDKFGRAGLEHATRTFSRDVTGTQLLAAFGDLEGFWKSLTVRQFRRRAPKVHGKSFNLERFMSGR
ncbi:MAG: colanic acid biosynthesis glycosyltransferase WcaL [Verrucomicrobiaceae bacterium]|nr:colanic acid biosynthesis glycosyltransferase WcaL [Verrucomicrobiaceae bacterium]